MITAKGKGASKIIEIRARSMKRVKWTKPQIHFPYTHFLMIKKTLQPSNLSLHVSSDSLCHPSHLIFSTYCIRKLRLLFTINSESLLFVHIYLASSSHIYIRSSFALLYTIHVFVMYYILVTERVFLL